MWHLKTTGIPAVIGALGIAAKTARKYESQMHRPPSSIELPCMYIHVHIYIYIYTYIHCFILHQLGTANSTVFC